MSSAASPPSDARRVPGDCLKCHRPVHTIVETGRLPYVEHVGPSCEEAEVEIVDGPPADAKQVGLDLADFGLTTSDVDD